MNRPGSVAFVLALTLLAVACGAPEEGAEASPERRFLSIGTAPPGGAFFVVGGALGEVLNEFKGENPWRYEGERPNMYQVEHDELFAAIRRGSTINDGAWMANSTMMAIAGRMAAYTGQTIEWDQAMESIEDLTPPAYEFGSLPTPPVAMPGETKFV